MEQTNMGQKTWVKKPHKTYEDQLKVDIGIDDIMNVKHNYLEKNYGWRILTTHSIQKVSKYIMFKFRTLRTLRNVHKTPGSRPSVEDVHRRSFLGNLLHGFLISEAERKE